MKQRAAVVILKNQEILLMHRFYRRREYYALPGGTIEPGESAEEAAIREAKEETTLDVKLDRLLWEYADTDFDGRMNYFFLVTEFSGEAKLSGPEAELHSEENQYILEWHRLDELDDLLLYPLEIKERIQKELAQ